jgi:hypothetical protein
VGRFVTVGDWTLSAVKEHFEALRASDELRSLQLREAQQIALTAALASAEKAVQTALLAAKEAVVKAEIATEKRLEGLNELRQGVATKDALDAMDRRLNELKETVALQSTTIATITAAQSGRSGGLKDYIGWIVAAVSIISALWAILIRK